MYVDTIDLVALKNDKYFYELDCVFFVIDFVYATPILTSRQNGLFLSRFVIVSKEDLFVMHRLSRPLDRGDRGEPSILRVLIRGENRLNGGKLVHISQRLARFRRKPREFS